MNKHLRTLLQWWIILVLLLIIFNSCTTQRKAEKYLNRHPEVAAGYCGEKFPPKDSLIVRTKEQFDTLYKESVRIDSVIYCDSVVEGKPVKHISIQCPPTQIITRTIHTDSTFYVRNTAKETQLEKQKETVVKILDKTKDKLKRRNTLVLWLLAIVLGETLWILRKPILKLLIL